MESFKLTVIYCDKEGQEIYHEVIHCKSRDTLQLYADWKERTENVQYRIEEE